MPAARGRTRGRRPDQSRAAMRMLIVRYWGDRLGGDDRPERLVTPQDASRCLSRSGITLPTPTSTTVRSPASAPTPQVGLRSQVHARPTGGLLVHGKHAGSVVPPDRGRGVVAGPGVRGARRSRVAVGAVGTAHPRRGRRPGKGTCGCGVARAILENDRIAGGLLGTALHVAAGLGAAGTAAMLLEPFRVETVAAEQAGGLAAAAGLYGEEWTRGVIDG